MSRSGLAKAGCPHSNSGPILLRVMRETTTQRFGGSTMRGRSIAYQVGSIPNDTGTTSATPANAARSGASIHSALGQMRSEEHTSELQSLMRSSYAVFCLHNKRSNHRRTRFAPTNGIYVTANTITQIKNS